MGFLAIILCLSAYGKNFSHITKLLDEASEIIPNMAFSASTADEGRIFTYEHGDITMDKVIHVASSSKWVSATTILRQATLGKFSLDDLICKYFDWWSCNATDDPFGVARANVTVRNTMSFLDGTGGLAASSNCPNNETTFEDCTKGLYNLPKIWRYNPNTTFDYNEYHLQFAGSVAEKVAGKTIDVLLNDTLKALNMSNSYYAEGKTPDISSALHTTGDDYDKFLSAIYHQTFPDLNSDMYAEMESDYSVGKQYSPFGREIQGFIGHYGLGNWLDCGFIDYNNMTLWPWCEEQNIRSCIGAFGYYPVMDRSRKYWNQFVMEHDGDPLQVPISVVVGRVVKDELDVILAPEVSRGQNSCGHLSMLLNDQLQSYFGDVLSQDDIGRLHLLIRRLEKVLEC